MEKIQQVAKIAEEHSHDLGAMHFVLGGFDLGFYIGWCLFAFVGFIIEKLLAFRNRKNNKKFNALYFLEDNAYDMILGFLVTITAGRFHADILQIFPVGWADKVNIMFLALAFGFAHTLVFQMLRKWKAFGKHIKSKNHYD